MGAPLCLGVALAFAAACDGAAGRPAPTTGRPATAAPVARAPATAGTCPGNGAHGKHVQDLGLDCAVCHPSGATYGFTSGFTYPRGTAATGTIVPSTATTPATCSVGCHSPLGAAVHAVEWTAPGPLECTACHDTATLPPTHPAVTAATTRAECQVCHDTATHASGAVTLVGHDASWMDQASPGFHAFAAERGLSRCQTCHGQGLDGGAVGVSCATCHDRSDPTHPLISWKTDCIMCHGGTDGATGAPPEAIWGHRDEPIRVGAHTSHVTGSAIAPALSCGECHVTPGDVFAPGHIDELTDPAAVPAATVAFGGLATLGGAAPSWDRTSGTCASTYCHGATLDGGTNRTPSWTVVDGSQAACGTCHGLPPGGAHPSVDPATGLAACAGCHGETVDAAGAVIPPAAGGKHLDGVVEAAGHPAAWTDRTSAGFHAYSANLGLASCQQCHGQDLAGGSAGVACASCHGPGGQAASADFSTCTGCHGGTDNGTGAPPRTTWGQSADPVRVGAHTRHLTAGLAPPFDCAVCHVKPADMFSAGHVDAATATVTFGGVAVAGGAVPVWDRAGPTCASTYCHGNFPGGNAANAPSWTAPVPDACGTCHGLPPGGIHPASSDCGQCHDGYTATTVNTALHVNGSVDVMNLTCTSCHGDPARPATAQNPQLAAAPPRDTFGNLDPSAPGVGAHQSHLQPGAISGAVACTECHAVPTSTTHANGVDDVTFGPLASVNGSLSPAWDPAALTCASTYCHGATLTGGSHTAPVWNRVGQGEAACGACHGLPPPAPHPTVADLTGCVTCHPDTMDATGALVPPSAGGKHLDGTIDASGTHAPGWMDTASPEFHAYSANAGLSSCQTCHGVALDGVGGMVSVSCAQCHGPDWTTRCTMCHGGLDNSTGAPPVATWGNASPIAVGAHSSHVGPNPVAAPFGCQECHATPADAFAPGHIDASVDVTFAGALSGLVSGATWGGDASPTCSSTYCHGNFLRGNAANAPSWIGADQAACGTCHPARPPAYLHYRHSRDYTSAGLPWWPLPGESGWVTCDQCHSGIASSTDFTSPPTLDVGNGSGPALHVNGTADVVFKWGGSYGIDPAFGGQCSSMACHPGETKYWPR